MTQAYIFICNPAQTAYVDESLITISSREAFEAFFKEKTKLDKLKIIVLAELKWDNFHYTDFIGLDLIYEIRLFFNLQCPILLCSNYPNIYHEFVEEKSDFPYHNKLRCLKDPSIHFIPLDQILPLSLKNINQLFKPALDEYLLEDVKQNIYKLDGFLVDYFNTQIEELLNKNISTYKRADLLSFFREKLSLFQNNFLVPEDLLQSDFGFPPNQLEFTPGEIRGFTESFKDKLRSFLEKRQNSQNEKIYASIQTIYIHNDHNLASELSNDFKKLGITLFKATELQDLLQTLKKHSRIRVIICDFRFYEEDKSWSYVQGFHIYRYVMKNLSRFFEFILLTDLDTYFIPEHLKVKNLTYFPKKQLFIHSLGITKLSQLILTKDLKIKESYKDTPQLGDAINFYYRHQLSEDIEIWEEECTAFVIDVIQKIKAGQTTNLPKLPSLSGTISGKNEENNFENFKTKLKARRLALALYQIPRSYLSYYKDDLERWIIIYGILLTGSINKKATGRQVSPFLSRHLLKLGIKKDYSWINAYSSPDLTAEEKQWLHNWGPDLEKRQD